MCWRTRPADFSDLSFASDVHRWHWCNRRGDCGGDCTTLCHSDIGRLCDRAAGTDHLSGAVTGGGGIWSEHRLSICGLAACQSGRCASGGFVQTACGDS